MQNINSSYENIDCECSQNITKTLTLEKTCFCLFYNFAVLDT